MTINLVWAKDNQKNTQINTGILSKLNKMGSLVHEWKCCTDTGGGGTRILLLYTCVTRGFQNPP